MNNENFEKDISFIWKVIINSYPALIPLVNDNIIRATYISCDEDLVNTLMKLHETTNIKII